LRFIDLYRDINRRNTSISTANVRLRYFSIEEKEYKYGSFDGMLSSWTFFRKIDTPIGGNKLFFTRKYVKETPGMPEDLSRLIATFFTRKDANTVAQTCRKARQEAQDFTKNYVTAHGKSYQEIPYLPNPFMALVFT
jgi:hypothetical protein